MLLVHNSGLYGLNLWEVILGVVVVTYITFLVRTALRPGLRKIPGPPLARVSNLYLMLQSRKMNMHTLFSQLHRDYGKVVRFGPNKVDIADPAYIPVIYGVSSKFIKAPFYESFTNAHDGSILDNLFATRDPAWHKRVKSAIAPAYSLSYLRHLEPLVDECTGLFIDAMQDLAGQPIDLGEWLQWYAFDTIGNITFSKTFGFIKDRADKNDILDGLEFGNRYNTVIGQVPGWHPWLIGNWTLVNNAMKIPAIARANPIVILNQMLTQAINNPIKSGVNKTKADYLDFLRGIVAANPGRLSDREIWSALLVNLFAGSDTTAMSLRAVFYFLVQNSEAYRKLQAEIDEADGARRFGELVDFETGSNLPYLQAVLKEAMRLHPGVSYPLERVVPPGGVEVCGHYLPEGTVVGMHAWVIHRDSTIFGSDANQFKPERWLQSDIANMKRMESALLTFGYGSRTCLGKHISILEMTKVVPQVMRNFDFEWAEPGMDWTINAYWFAKQSGLIMKLHPRHSGGKYRMREP